MQSDTPPNVVKPAGAAPARGFVQADAPRVPVGRDFKLTAYVAPGAQDEFDAALAALWPYPGIRRFSRGAGVVLYIPGNLWPVVRPQLKRLAAACHSANVDAPNPLVTGDPWRFVAAAIEHGDLRATVPRADDPAVPLVQWVRAFQRHFVRWSILADGGFAIHPPGSGKTVSGIIAAAALAHVHGALREHAPWVGLPVVVITRAVVRGQWRREIQRLTHWDPWVSDPEAAQRTAWEPLPAYLIRCWLEGRRPVIVGAWDDAPRWAFTEPGEPGLLDLLRGVSYVLVMDEVHNAKSAQRRTGHVDDAGATQYTRAKNRAGAVELLALHAATRIALTGTPIPDRVRDLYGIHTLLEPKGWGLRWTPRNKNGSGFADRYCDARPGAYGGMDDRGATHLEELAARRAEVCHVVLKDEARQELPPFAREVYRVPAAGLGRANAETTAELRRITKEVGSTRRSDAKLEAELAVAASRKRPEVLLRVLEAWDAGQKVTVFTGRRADVTELVESIRRALATKGVTEAPTVWGTHGEDSGFVRDQIACAYFAAPGPAVLVATGPSMGEGVNLHSTDLAIFAQIPYTPREVEQWEGRFLRLGLDRPVTLLYLIAAGTVDERVAWILADKLPAVESQVPGESTAALAAAIKGTDDPSAVLAQVLQSVADAVASGIELDPDDRD